MMNKILFLADLHGNMLATLALEEEMKKIQPDKVWFLGDCVGKGPESHKTTDWVRANCNHFIGGNWDKGCVEFSKNCPPGFESDVFYWNQLGKERLDWLESLPLEDEVWISGINFRLLHGRPSHKNFHNWLPTSEIIEGFTNKDGKKFGGFICADCHQAYVREFNEGYAVNTGSVGNSLGTARCHALLIEGEYGSKTAAPISFKILSIPYDNQRAVKIVDDYPELPKADAYKAEVINGVYSR